jgi:thiol-disulfide isomerase/thioredoxin
MRIEGAAMRSAVRTLALMTLLVAGQATAISPGDVPPDNLGLDGRGHEVHLSDHRGKVVVVSFWASWCGYCRKELPVLAGLQDAAGKDRIEVIAVNTMDDRDVYLALRRKLKDIQLTMTRDASGSVGEAFGIRTIPHLFIVDRAGRIAAEHSGYGEESLQEIVDEVNRQLAVPMTGS